MSLNTDTNEPPTVAKMVSEPNSARKPLNSARKPLVVRQTVTSKLRAERGNQLTYYTAKLQELSERTLSRDSSVSKESIKSVNQMKKPQANSVFKTPMPPKSETTNSSVQNRAKVNLTAAFKTPVHKIINKTTELKKNSTNLAERRNVPKEVKTPAMHAPKSQKENIKPSDKVVSNSAKIQNTTITSKYLNTTARITTIQPKPALKNAPKTAVFGHGKNFVSQNIHSAKKPSTRTDPTKKPVQYGPVQRKEPEPKAPALKPAPTAAASANVKSKNLTLEKKKVTIQSPIRKSLTAMHFKRTTNKNRNSTIHRTHSLATLPTNQNAAFTVGPIKEEHSDEIVFKTPSLAQRRSVAFLTPMSSRESFGSPFVGDSVHSPVDLRRRLSVWLEKRGKPVGSYHHLRCFNLQPLAEPAADEEENKENIEVQVPDINSSYTDLSIDAKETKNVDPLLVANDALFDLQQLIQEGYPRTQCEAWLEVISSRYAQVEERPQYWECRAALEEARGDFTVAVDCYKRAIIKGAEVRVVDASLENLLQKFSVLNITPTKARMDTEEEVKSAVQAKNMFRSSIINFAIQERSKKSEQDVGMSRFVATPVRRSTRLSRSKYASAPGLTICQSLNDLDASIRNSLEFKANKALH